MTRSATPASQWEIVPYRGPEGLQELRGDWLRLHEELPFQSISHSFGATEVYLRHLCPSPETFTCFALTDGEVIRGICPLERATQWLLGMHVPVWRLPRHAHWAIADVVCPEGEPRRQLVPRLVEHLRAIPGSPSILELSRIPEYSALLEGIAELHPLEHCPDLNWYSRIIDCTGTFEEIASSLTKRARQDRKRAHRRLEQSGDVKWVIATSPTELQTELESMLAVEASGWKGADGTGTAIACHPELVSFYRDLVQTLSQGGECEIVSLYADGGCLASDLCARGRDEYIMLKGGYDEASAALSRGKLITETVIKRCCDDASLQRVNLLTEMGWLRSWGASAVPVTQTHVAITPLGGNLCVALFRLQRMIRAQVLRYRERSARPQHAEASRTRR